MPRIAMPLLALLLAAASGSALADPLPGKAKANPCAACHGALGVGVLPDTPNLAGQPERYVAEQLKAFRSGKRTHEVMSLVAKPLSDADIAELAAWYASLQVEVKERP
jgi:cytochrome c553